MPKNRYGRVKNYMLNHLNIPSLFTHAGGLPADISRSLLWLLDILDSISDGVLIIDTEETIIYANPAYCRLTGLHKNDLINQQLSKVRPGAMLPQVVATGNVMRGVLRKHGDVEYVVDMAPIITDGKIAGGVTIARDISDIRKLANELSAKQSIISSLKKKLSGSHQAKFHFADIIGESQSLTQTVGFARKAALGDSNVLICGETGTGKELFAHAIHNASKRAKGPFVPINCSALPSNLLESELFGYEEGAFSGAKKGGKPGLFEIAHGGTLFLDEVTDMDPGLQAKLLRCLQSRYIRRVGGLTEKPVDVRIISATNCDIESQVEQQHFRMDLYFRLNIMTVKIPPLRERKEDIPVLINFFLTKYGTSRQSFSKEAVKTLLDYNWPGNVRELENAVEVAIQMCDGDFIEPCHLPSAVRLANSSRFNTPQRTVEEDTLSPLKELTEAAEKEALITVLNSFGFSFEGKKAAAKALGISLSTLYNKIKTLKIDADAK